jgi:hypothetical protein
MTEYHSIMDTKDNQQEPLVTIHAEVPPPKDVEGGSQDDDAHDEKVCRICLEDDHPDQMIAPCQCKGGSKWVHRECLDLWRTNEKDRAFSQCTECLYKYHMMTVPQHQASTTKWRRAKFYMLVSRDILLVTLGLQVVIGILGAFVWLCDSDEKSLLELFCGGTTCPNGDWHAVGVYYVCGFLLLLVLMGLYGSITLCFNECSIQQSIPTFIDPEQGGTTHSNSPTLNKSATYQNHRQRQRQRHYSSPNTCCDRGRGCDGCCFYGYGYQPIYYGGPSGNDDCCCCCCGSLGPPHHNSSSSNNNNSDCWCRGCDSGGGDGDCVHILLVVLVVTAVIMAVIGFCVGIIIAVVMCQRVIQTHVYLLHKRQLVQEFTVMDLQEYDDVLPESEISAPCAPLQYTYIPPPSAPPMHQEDEIYLQKLGLMEKR